MSIGCFILSYLLSLRHGVCSYIDSDPNGLWGLLTSALAVIAFCCFCQLIERVRLSCVEIVSKATIFILGAHVLLIVALDPLLHFKGNLGYSFVVAMVLLSGLTCLYYLANKMPFF